MANSGLEFRMEDVWVLSMLSNAVNGRLSPWIHRFAVGILAALCFVSISIAVRLAWTSNYGGYNDVYLMLDTFLRVVREGVYSPSRFTGYPAAEIGIGSLAWLGGSSLSNLVTYGLFLGSVLLFPFCFSTRLNVVRTVLFLAMALTSPVMTFDNLQSIDYPWSLFFWVLGCFCLRRYPDRMIAAIPLAISIGCRPAFAVFVMASILFNDSGESMDSVSFSSRLRKRWPAVITVVFSGCLFYLPAWLSNGFSLGWVSAIPPDNQGPFGVLARFVYKTSLAIGFLPLLFVLLLALWVLLNRRHRPGSFLDLPKADGVFLLAITVINLLIFLRIPAQQSYLQPFLLCFYFTLSRLSGSISTIFSLLISALNFTTWFVQPRLLDIRYQPTGLCGKVVAEGARFDISPDPGRLEAFLKGSRKARCYAPWFRDIGGADYSAAVFNGEALRLVRAPRQTHRHSSSGQP